ncbi:MAG: hypothetical protein FWE47_02500 [Oscillospiraceae bacterium]|nr:hypothetical protein [Oscillospiraceae bacterium]
MSIEEIRAIKRKIDEELGKNSFEVMQKRFSKSTEDAEKRIEEIRRKKEMA